MFTLLDTDTNLRLEATRVLSDIGPRLEATGISTSAYIFKEKYWITKLQKYSN